MKKNTVMATTVKKVDARLTALEQMIAEFKQTITNQMPANEAEYIAKFRYPINIKVVEIALGCSYGVKDTKKGEQHFVKLNAKAADNEQLLKLGNILRDWLEFEETAIFDSVAPDWHNMSGAAVTSTGEDLDIECSIEHFTIQMPAKLNAKAIGKMIIGAPEENIPGAVALYLDDINIQELAVIGEKIRKHKELMKWIFIGAGTLILVGGCTAAAICIAHNSKQDAEALPDDITDDVDLDDDVHDDIVEDDEPVEVEMEFAM